MPRIRTLILTLALILTFLIPGSTLADDKPLTTEEQTWLTELSQDPARVRALILAEENATRMEHWNSVTAVGVNYLVFCSSLNGRDPGPEITSSTVGTSVVVAYALEMPRKMAVPFKVQIHWKLNGVLDRMDTHTVTDQSPNYRLWDRQTMSEAGTWTATVVYNGHELATTTITVTE